MWLKKTLIDRIAVEELNRWRLEEEKIGEVTSSTIVGKLKKFGNEIWKSREHFFSERWENWIEGACEGGSLLKTIFYWNNTIVVQVILILNKKWFI